MIWIVPVSGETVSWYNHNNVCVIVCDFKAAFKCLLNVSQVDALQHLHRKPQEGLAADDHVPRVNLPSLLDRG